jgi:hypothetical protein
MTNMNDNFNFENQPEDLKVDKDLFTLDEEPLIIEREVSRPIEEIKFREKIFQFLRRNYIQMGYDDALSQPDFKFLNDNIEFIYSDFSLLLEEAELAYQEYLNQLDFHHKSRLAAGLNDIAEELAAKKVNVLADMDFVLRNRRDLTEKTGNIQRLILSYKKGFMKGFSALSYAGIINKIV